VRAATVLAVGLVLSCLGCGSNDAASTTPSTAAPPGSLQALWQRPGEDVGLVFGTNDYAPGPVRVSFLVVTQRARSIERPTARVWLSRGLDKAPFRTGSARLEDIGGGQHIYVTTLDVPEPGTYWLLAEPVGGAKRIQGVGNVVVASESKSPALGADAFPSKNPTLDDAPAEEITTARPPDTELLRTSIKSALDAHEPFVVVFATPKYCQSRTCGPVVGVVDRVRKRFASTPVKFIHVEVYEGNNPALGENRWFMEWKLQSEPWVFIVGRDGKIKAKFEGPVSERELGEAVSEFLT
jgi:hypothetical protein